MEEKEIKKIIKKGESETVEFKSSLSEWRNALETLVAFSWNKGGTVIFGISPTRKIVGVEVGKGTIESLANSIKQNTDPKLYPSIKVFKIEDNDIILVEIKKISDEPVLAFGKAYKRIGKSTHQMSREEYKRVIKSSYEQEFDGQICEKATLKEINWEAVNRFKERYEEINSVSIKSSSKELLKSLKCIKEIDNKIKITNASVLLFGKNPDKFFPMSYVTVVRYPGIEKESKYLDIKDFYGNLFDIIDNVNSYIKEHVQEISEVIEGQIARKVIPQYPYFAIRELITNAVCHRDYTNIGSRIIIRMFKDKIEFNSPGGLPANITPKNIIYEQYSRNPIIADVLNRVKYIEKLGEGWDKIIDSIKKHPFQPKLPEVIDTGNTVVITLYSPKEMVEREEKIDKNTVDEWLTQVDAKLTQELSDKEKEMLLFILRNKRISSLECRQLLNISREMANRYFNRLIEKGLIEKKGAGKYVYYVLRVMQR